MFSSRQVLTIAFATILASTLLLEVAHSQAVFSARGSGKKKIALKVLSAIAMIARYTRPKKGIMPIPIPLPVPLPIEWEQPPVVIHPKQHYQPPPPPQPYPVPYPVPYHQPSYESYGDDSYGGYGGGY